MTFEEIMDFHPGNRDVYNEIKESLRRFQLLPFIGAGLTARFYGSWSTVLEALAEKIASESDRKTLSIKLKSYDYLGAAQFLEQKRGKRNLLHDMVHYFSRDKLTADLEILRSEAVYLLPSLFSCPVLTTNFDEGIEEVYYRWQESHFRVLNPASESLREQARRLVNTPCVFKIHGSIDGNMMDYDKLVFTKEQYDYFYCSEGEARAALREFAKGRILLFLGCSLDKDRTVDVLQELAGMGTIHYAIVHPEGKDPDQRLRELDDLGIRAILYPDGQHISVRIILEQLLQDLHPEEYEKLSLCFSALPKSTANPYVYRSHMTPLLGRDEELEQLKKFVTSTSDPFLWWALIGPGGSGKSKLAMELKDLIDNLPGWICDTLTDFSDLKSYFAQCTRSTLVVVDYVQAHARELGEQMEALTNARRTHPIRLLLVERNDPKESYNWTEQLYENVHHKADLRNLCWGRQFLELNPLKDEPLIEIIHTFAENLRQKGISDHSAPTNKECEVLLERLKAIDKGLRRPLYAMFLTGAWMQGEEPTHWSQEQVLDYIIERECTLLDEHLRQLTGKSKKNRLKACLALYRISTARLGPELDEILSLFPEQKRRYIEQAAEDAGLDGPKELLEQMSLLRDDKLVPMEPDLMGEYFVYQWLIGEAKEDQRQVFLKAVWGDSLSAAVFFDRLFSDYAHQLNQNPDDWGVLLPPLDWLTINPDRRCGLMYANLSNNTIAYCTNSAQCRRIANQMEEVYHRFREDQEITLRLATGLFNLSITQDKTEECSTIDQLRALSEQRPKDREIALVFASGLGNLSYKQDEAGAHSTITQLEELFRLWQGDREIALVLAQGLVNLSIKQDGAGISATIARLEEIVEQWKEDQEFVLALAKGLANLSVTQNKVEASATIARLEALVEQRPEDQEIALELAKGLYSFSMKQSENENRDTIARLETLVGRWPKNRGIALMLANMLVNISSEQDAAEAGNILAQLEKLSKRWPEDREIALELAKGLFNCSFSQDKTGASATIARLEQLAERYPEDQGIALVLANGLVSLSFQQDTAGASAAIDRLEELAKQWPENREIALRLANGLINLPLKQNETIAGAAIDRLEELTKKWPEDREVELRLAKGLVNRSVKQDELGARSTVVRLEELYRKWPEYREFALELAKGLVNISNKQDKAGACTTISWLEELSRQWPNDQEIELEIAKGLCNLTSLQDEAVTGTAITGLEELAEQWPEEQEIVLLLAQGLFNLSIAQDEIGASATVARLEELVERCPENHRIVLVLAGGLVNLSFQQDVAGARAAVDRLEELARKWPENREFELRLAKGLVNLTNLQDETGASATIDRLKELARKWPEDREFELLRVKGLVNLVKLQDETGASATIDQLDELVERWPEDREFELELAKGLVNLTNLQDEAGASATADRLEELVEKWPENREFALELAKGLVNFSNKRDRVGACTTISWLEELSRQWPDDQEIALQLATGLYNLANLQAEAEASSTIARLNDLVRQWTSEQESELALPM